jgi:hypothetical protein
LATVGNTFYLLDLKDSSTGDSFWSYETIILVSVIALFLITILFGIYKCLKVQRELQRELRLFYQEDSNQMDISTIEKYMPSSRFSSISKKLGNNYESNQQNE